MENNNFWDFANDTVQEDMTLKTVYKAPYGTLYYLPDPTDASTVQSVDLLEEDIPKLYHAGSGFNYSITVGSPSVTLNSGNDSLYPNIIIGVDLPNIETIGNDFLSGLGTIRHIFIPDAVKTIGNNFITRGRSMASNVQADTFKGGIVGKNVVSIGLNFLSYQSSVSGAKTDFSTVTEISFPKLETLGRDFMTAGAKAVAWQQTPINMPKLKTAGNYFLAYQQSRNDAVLSFPELEEVGDRFLYNALAFSGDIIAPKLRKIGNAFMGMASTTTPRAFNKVFNFPELEEIGDGFMYNSSQSYTAFNYNQPISFPKVRKIGSNFMGCSYGTEALGYDGTTLPLSSPTGTVFNNTISLPLLEEVGSQFLMWQPYFNTALSFPNLTKIGDGFLRKCYSFNQSFDFSNVEEIGADFLYACKSYNHPIDLSGLVGTEIPDCFVSAVSNTRKSDTRAKGTAKMNFNSTITFSSAIKKLGKLFLAGCGAFNQSLDFSHIEDIDEGFMLDCNVFNQAVDFSSVKIIQSYDITQYSQPYAAGFMVKCYAFNHDLRFPSYEDDMVPHVFLSMADRSFYSMPSASSYKFASTVEFPQTVTKIGAYCMYGCAASPSWAFIMGSITEIGRGLFNFTRFNQTLDLSNITSISNNFLSNCPSFNQTLDLSNITSIGDNFLGGCSSFNQPLSLPSAITSIGNNFLSGCSNFNQTLDLSNITSIGEYFLNYCRYFNQQLNLTNVTSIGRNFLSYSTSFNQPLDITGISRLEHTFLAGCTAFDQPLDFSNITYIGGDVLKDCSAFNQPITLSSSLTTITGWFLYNCTSMVSPVDVGSLDAAIANSNNNTFSTTVTTAPAYTQGIPIKGANRAAWIARFPDRTSNPYRKLLDYGS